MMTKIGYFWLFENLSRTTEFDATFEFNLTNLKIHELTDLDESKDQDSIIMKGNQIKSKVLSKN